MKYCALAACIAVAACAPRLPVDASAQAESCHGGPVTLWLDFEGAGVVHADADDSAATPPASSLAPTNAVIPPFSSTAIAPSVTRDQAMAAIVDRVRTLLLPFDVEVITARPAAAPYTRIFVGGTQDALGISATEAGIAHVDCGNLTDDDVAYDFADEQTPDYGGVVGIANTAAHEFGHAVGLEHVDDPHDVMYAAATPALTLPDLFTLGFHATGAYTPYGSTSGARMCTTSDPIDEPAILDCAVGAAVPGSDVTAPIVDWPAPADPVASPLSITATASDDVGVVRVEAYKNLELVASLDAPPYTFAVAAAAGEHFYVTVEAIDAAGNRATRTRALDAATPSPTVDAGAAPPDLATTTPITMPTASHGCAFATDAASPSALVFAALALVAIALRRWSARGSSAPRRR
ncbi:MAG TPA: Ig-like domain-containing protein [Polyangia bacterium]|jgi:hypothetical protein